jgi:hypothetical protein
MSAATTSCLPPVRGRRVAARLGVKIPMEPARATPFLLTPKQMPKHGILFADIHAG